MHKTIRSAEYKKHHKISSYEQARTVNVERKRISSDFSFVNGNNNEVVGRGNTVRGDHVKVTGIGNQVSGVNATVVGDESHVVGIFNHITGDRVKVQGDDNTIVGNSNTIEGARNTVYGTNNKVNGAKIADAPIVQTILPQQWPEEPEVNADKQDQCKVCMERGAVVAAVPCGHTATCVACTLKDADRQEKKYTRMTCIVCRADVHQYMRTFK